MFKNIYTTLKKPPLYEKSAVAFWDDQYISKQMLKAHLDPDFEGASRKLSFINQSAAWISKLLPPTDYPSLLDVGCGPGIYAERFVKAGYQVTGIDFSRRSINYAKESAANQGLDIAYNCQDYLKLDLNADFDIVTMIYCDYGALSTADRGNLLSRVYQSLRPGGRFLLDVFSMAAYDRFEEKQTWDFCLADGFWRQDAYLALSGFYRYAPNVTLEEICIVSEKELVPYYLWTTYFTAETLSKEAASAGFKVLNVFGDMAGNPGTDESQTLAILLKK
ncbi:class I SAM-dependent methyltransferase [Emergencia timonensis]|nr:class I SAM-dependent methyltransferase [Emergencia timonensis]